MASDAIRVRELGKRYRVDLPRERYKTLRESLTSSVTRSVLNSRRHARGDPDERFVWALEDVSLDVQQGEVVGIVGRNGAGKSTLLKVLSRITEPTTGFAEVRGRVGSLLEVGSGFHLELTGRENIYLNGAILGMHKKEIDDKFDEIVSFAAVERFVETPVKRYSSGMYMRLAFAVAAHLETEIILVDEVLAVGDVAFQRKCLGKLDDVARSGRTVLFVSHNMAAVRRLCPRALLIEGGRLALDAQTDKVIDRYLGTLEQAAENGVLEPGDTTRRSGIGGGRIARVEILDNAKRASTTFGIAEAFRIHLDIALETALKSLVLGVEFRTLDGTRVLNLRSDGQGLSLGTFSPGDTVRAEIVIPGLPLYPESYVLSPWFGEKGGKRMDHIEDALTITLVSTGRLLSEALIQPRRGLVLVDCDWSADSVGEGTPTGQGERVQDQAG
jgi:lipopolysaccharide transport system ATP-binding protein